MARFWFTGRATLSGVHFLIEADSREDAIAQARRQEWDDYYDISSADIADWEIDPNSLMEEDE